jgi:hypothetical protein
LFRAFELYPYSHVTDMASEDSAYADAITQIARNQVMRVFPVLDFLDCAGSVPAMINPLNWVRLSQRFGAYFINKQAKVIKREDIQSIKDEFGIDHDMHMTRSEELEIDDVAEKADTFAKRKEVIVCLFACVCVCARIYMFIYMM